MSQADDRTTTIPSRRALLAGLSVAAAAGVAALPADAAAEVDPIFAVIAAYRAAVQAYCAACNAPDDECDEDLVNETCLARIDAIAELMSCRPTTLPGVVALLEQLGEPDHGHDPEDTVLVGSVGNEPLKALVNELPCVLAETLRNLLDRGAQS